MLWFIKVILKVSLGDRMTPLLVMLVTKLLQPTLPRYFLSVYG